MSQKEEEKKEKLVLNLMPAIQQVLRNNNKTEEYKFNPSKTIYLNKNVVLKMFSEARSRYFIVKAYEYNEIEPDVTARIIKWITEMRNSKAKPNIIAIQNIVNIVELIQDKDGGKLLVQIEDDVGAQDLHFFFHNRKSPLSKEEVFNFMYQMARSLALCQYYRLYHKDVKPSNFILMKGYKDKQLIKLIDFNISKMLRTETGITHNKGTFAYWSYERFEEAASTDFLLRDTYKFEHDVYSLGITILEMLVAGTKFAKPLKTYIQTKADSKAVMIQKTGAFMKMLDQLEKDRDQSWSDIIFITKKLLTPKAEDRGDFFTLLGLLKCVAAGDINNSEEFEDYFDRECEKCRGKFGQVLDRRNNPKQLAKTERYLTRLTKFDEIIDINLRNQLDQVPEFVCLPNQSKVIPFLNQKELKLYIFDFNTSQTKNVYKLDQIDLPLESAILYNSEGYLGIYGGGLRADSFKTSDAHFKLNFDGKIASEKKLPNNGYSHMAGTFVNSSTVLLAGGINGDGSDKNCIWFNYKESKEWSLGPKLRYPRLNPAVVCVGQSVYVIGGTWSQGAESQEVDELFYHQKIIEVFDRSEPVPRWRKFELQIPPPVLAFQQPFTIPLNSEQFLMFAGRRYKSVKDDGVYLCNVNDKSVRVFADWFYELRLTPTNPAYTSKKKDEFYFAHQFMGRTKPQFYSFKLHEPERQGDFGRVIMKEHEEE